MADTEYKKIIIVVGKYRRLWYNIKYQLFSNNCNGLMFLETENEGEGSVHKMGRTGGKERWKMKGKKKLLYAGLLFLVAVLLCVPASRLQAKTPKLSRKKLTMTVGQKKVLKVKNTKKKVTWKSGKPKVVRVSKKGVLTAKKAGKAVVKAKVGKKTLKCTVTVKKKSGKKEEKKDEDKLPVSYGDQESGECREKGDIYYIRTNGYQKDAKYPKGTLICSREQLQKYYQENRENYSMEGSFKETIDSFEDCYFEKNQLAVLLLETSSGSNRYRVVKGYFDKEKKEYQVQVEVLRPGEGMAGTCDMAQWHILIPITDKIPEESTVTVTEVEPEANRFEQIMQRADLDQKKDSQRSLAEYAGVQTLTNGFTANPLTEQGRQAFTGVQNFSYQLFGETIREGVNPAVSPMSAYFALSMAAAGAEGETRAEFDKVLGTASFDVLCGQLKKHLSDVKGSTELSIGNSVWTNQDLPVSEEYLQKIVDYFDSEVYSGPIASEEMKDAINQWVSEKTRGMIPELLNEPLDSMALMALVNTVYMNAEWANTFSANSTCKKTFYKEDGSEIETDFMNDTRILDYVETEDAQGAVLDYDDGKTVFLALRPNDGNSVRELAGRLDASAVRSYIANARPVKFYFSMPKLNTEYEIPMKDMLQNMRLKRAFAMEAEFGKMLEPAGRDLTVNIGEVLQKVKVEVDEKGTKAAAATIVRPELTAPSYHYPEVIRTLELDSPYVYVIVDLPTQTPLFMGIVDYPVQKP